MPGAGAGGGGMFPQEKNNSTALLQSSRAWKQATTWVQRSNQQVGKTTNQAVM